MISMRHCISGVENWGACISVLALKQMTVGCLSFDCPRRLHHFFISQVWLSLLTVSSIVVAMSLLTAVSPVSGWVASVASMTDDVLQLSSDCQILPACRCAGSSTLSNYWSGYLLYLLLLLISRVVSTVCRHTNNCAKRRTVGPGAGACSDINLPHKTPFKKSDLVKINKWMQQL